ncbi:MAG: serine/threonine-protein kinase [Polyangiaceae bacterium]
MSPRDLIALQAGCVVDGRYRLIRFLAEGGMGQVWVAEHTSLERLVALKVVAVPSPVVRARVLREARLLAALHHPAVVTVYDCGDLDRQYRAFDGGGQPLRGAYIAMELASEETLEQHLAARGPLPAKDAVQLLIPVLDGLAVAHRQGIIHRDLKPSNVVARRASTGALEDAKLLDFGIAHVERAAPSTLTAVGGVIGTPQYMAPEQIAGGVIGPHTDVWGFALTLLELVTGKPVWDAPEPSSVMARILGVPPTRPDPSRVDASLWAILERAIAKSREERIGSVVELRERLVRWSAASPSVVNTQPSPRASALDALDTTDDAPPSLDELIRKRFQDN